MATATNSVLGERTREEVGGGTIYINAYKGQNYNWNVDGSLNKTRLRKTLTEEGIHSYFDSDVGHGGGYTEDQERAMAEMRQYCGYNMG